MVYYIHTCMLQTSLCNTAIDNPSHRDRMTVINSILDYLDTDTILWELWKYDKTNAHYYNVSKWLSSCSFLRLVALYCSLIFSKCRCIYTKNQCCVSNERVVQPRVTCRACVCACFYFGSRYQLDEPEDLYNLQQQKWDPLIQFVNQRYLVHHLLFFKLLIKLWKSLYHT